MAGPLPGAQRHSLEAAHRRPWRDLPERYGPWRTVYARFVRWQRDGTWDRLLAQVQTKSDAVGEIIWEVSIDSSEVRAHHHAAGGPKKGAPSAGDEALGRSRGGLTTKLHLACDGHGRPLSIVLTPASATTAPNWKLC